MTICTVPYSSVPPYVSPPYGGAPPSNEKQRLTRLRQLARRRGIALGDSPMFGYTQEGRYLSLLEENREGSNGYVMTPRLSSEFKVVLPRLGSHRKLESGRGARRGARSRGRHEVNPRGESEGGRR
jgi:hypothetical protein